MQTTDITKDLYLEFIKTHTLKWFKKKKKSKQSSQKMGKHTKGYFTKEDIWMANKQEKSSTSLAIREIQIKNIMNIVTNQLE